MRNSLSARLLATTGIALVVTVVALVLLVVQFMLQRPEPLIARDLQGAADEITAAIRLDADGRVQGVELPDLMAQIYRRLPDDGGFRILDGDGSVLASSDGATRPFAPVGGGFDPAQTRFDMTRAGLGQHVITKRIGGADRPLYLQVMRSDRIHQAMLNVRRDRSLLILVIIIALPMTVFSVVVIVTLKRTVLKPLENVTHAASSIGTHNLGERLSTAGLPSELTPLIKSFNQTLERLEHGFMVQREFLAAAAHELKTPIALMRGQVELGQGRDRTVLLQDLDHMARQVHQLLHLAEVSERHNYRLTPLAIDAIVKNVVHHLERLALGMGVRLEYHGEAQIVRGDGGSVFILLRNLVENAIHHAPPGSVVSIRLERDRISVQDRGPGVSEADLPRIFDRFWRGKHRRDVGAGLGLSICREIATVHGWRVSVGNSDPGACFSVVFSCQ
jgi:signal transduction histidine kinase